MSILDAFARARSLLELPAGEVDPQALKRAFRRKTAEWPPDREPERFQQVRAAYELLSSPLAHAKQLLERPTPDAPLPRAPSVGPLPPALAARRLLGRVISKLDLVLPEDPGDTKP